MKKLLSVFLALTLVFALCGGALAAEETTEDLAGQIVILHTNDVHGAIDGYAKIAAVKSDYEARGADVLLFDAGDYIQGDPTVSVSQGATAIELMNLTGYDLAGIGNHEFDYGYDNLMTILESADFDVLCANAYRNGSLVFDANTTFTMEDGTVIGVFGLATPETATKANPTKLNGVTFLAGDDLYDCATEQVAALTEAGADYIVCLGHLGIDSSSAPNRSIDLLNNVDGIDLFIDSHSHSTLEDILAATDNTGKVNDAVLTSTGTKAANIGVVTIDPEEDTITAENVSLEEYTGSVQAVADYAAQVDADIDAQYGEVIGTTEVTLNGDRAPGNRTQETNMGDLITDAMLWFAKEQGDLGVDDDHVIALTNGGGIRAAIAAGDITKRDVNTVLPFGNTVAYINVTGEVLLEALEASTYCTPDEVGGFPQVAGIEFTVDTTKEYDQGDQYPNSTYYGPNSINRVTIQSINGQPFDPEANYVVVSNDFTAGGGDTYYAFSVANRIDTGIALDEVVMDYIADVLDGTVTAEQYGETQGRITVLTAVSELPFTDVSVDAWFYDAIKAAYDAELMDGVSETTFEPDTAMNRAMLVTMLYRLEGSPEVTTNVSEVFADCADDVWYSDAVVWAAENNIVSGRSETEFAPTATMTRQEMAVILYNYSVLKGAEAVTEPALEYGDADAIADWAANAVTFCTAEGLMSGVSETEFSPAGSATRAMGATVLVRMTETEAAA